LSAEEEEAISHAAHAHLSWLCKIKTLIVRRRRRRRRRALLHLARSSEKREKKTTTQELLLTWTQFPSSGSALEKIS
jgi:hypothetical protein